MRLEVNGEVRQSARTAAMINCVAEMVSDLSHVCGLQPCDLLATGNPDAPDFQKDLRPGAVVAAEIEGIGELRVVWRGHRNAMGEYSQGLNRRKKLAGHPRREW